MSSAIENQIVIASPISRKFLCVLLICISGFILFTTLQDYLEAVYNNSSFYLSESLLFSSFWWLFIIILPLQFLLLNKRTGQVNQFLPWIILIPILLHLFTFPLLVWGISGLFFPHTFRYTQTLQFELSNYLYILSFLYSVPISIQYFRVRQKSQRFDLTENQKVVTVTEFIISEGRKKIRVDLKDVYHISATPPYINFHLAKRKLLHNETLKAVLPKLDEKFVRIHKSTIVNLMEVQSYTSRLNGDYDLTMKNGIVLRISRNYAQEFREKFKSIAHRITPE
jgi:hypothetical protein